MAGKKINKVSRRQFLRVAGSTAAVVGASACGGMGGGNDDGGGGGGGGDNSQLSDRIDHIIFTMQENRSFDHYFGRMNDYRAMRGHPGTVDGTPADAGNPARDDPSQVVRPFHLPTERHENLSPSWNESHRQANRFQPASRTATMDGFVYSAAEHTRANIANGASGVWCDTQGVRAMGFYDWNDIPYYYELASKFAMSDRMFASVMAATEPNRMYLLGGSSFGYIRPIGNTEGGTRIDAPTIFDRLEDAGVSWKIYLESGPNPFSFFQVFRSYDRFRDRVRPAAEFLSDLSSGNLPQVVYYESGLDTGFDEHPKNNIQRGAAYMAQRINALMSSPVWMKSALFLTYDEPGGFYDHVPPVDVPAPDNIAPRLVSTDHPDEFTRTGFRVPFVAVSPWVRPNYVSSRPADHTSILKFIETRFGLSPLTQRDAAAHDLLDMFNFSSPAYEQPPSLPGQPTGGTDSQCNYVA